MKLLVWVTPAGTFDEGGVEQPSYLNFDTTLLGAPLGNEMQVKPPCALSLHHVTLTPRSACTAGARASVHAWAACITTFANAHAAMHRFCSWLSETYHRHLCRASRGN